MTVTEAKAQIFDIIVDQEQLQDKINQLQKIKQRKVKDEKMRVKDEFLIE